MYTDPAREGARLEIHSSMGPGPCTHSSPHNAHRTKNATHESLNPNVALAWLIVIWREILETLR